MFEMGCRGRVGVDGGEFRGAAEIFKEFAVFEQLGERDQLDGLILFVKFEKDFVEDAVGRDVKVIRGEVFFDGRSDVFGGLLHHGAQDAFLRTGGVGKGTRCAIFPGLHDLKVHGVLVLFLGRFDYHGWRDAARRTSGPI